MSAKSKEVDPDAAAPAVHASPHQVILNGIVGIGAMIRSLPPQSAAKLIHANLRVITDLSTKQFLPLPGDVKALLDVISELAPNVVIHDSTTRSLGMPAEPVEIED